MNLADFLLANSDAIIFGYTDILLCFFDFQMSGVHWSSTCFFYLNRVAITNLEKYHHL